MKLQASSMYRWRATASERRLYGGATVTEFLVEDRDQPGVPGIMVKGYGPTPGERKTYAMQQARAHFAKAVQGLGYMQGRGAP